jgi:hypothetical protein
LGAESGEGQIVSLEVIGQGHGHCIPRTVDCI